MKKFLNDPSTIVPESLAGLAAAHPQLVTVDLERRVVVRADAPVHGKVALVSGGGSGHEPLHAGYVGRGMLDAACAGAIFTAPPADSLLAATRAVDGGAGVLYVVKSYTGDLINFRLAAQLAEADGTAVESVLVNDDVAVEDSPRTAGRRGTALTMVVEKIAGASAETGASLPEVAAVARRVVAQGRSYGVALTSCTTPSAGAPTFELGPDEMEIGIGIHGERGRRRAPMAPAAEIVSEMVDTLLDDLSPSADAELLALVNGLGGTPLIELYLVYNELSTQLGRRGLEVARSLVGNYVTSLEMAGASITLLVLDDELLELWDAPVRTPALAW